VLRVAIWLLFTLSFSLIFRLIFPRYFIDLHIPLLLQPNIRKVFQVYRRGLAPEQSVGFPLLLGGPKQLQHQCEEKLIKIISTMLESDGVSGPSTSAAVKLFSKGRPNPNSVR
jgi:hypothetical protein